MLNNYVLVASGVLRKLSHTRALCWIAIFQCALSCAPIQHDVRNPQRISCDYDTYIKDDLWRGVNKVHCLIQIEKMDEAYESLQSLRPYLAESEVDLAYSNYLGYQIYFSVQEGNYERANQYYLQFEKVVVVDQVRELIIAACSVASINPDAAHAEHASFCEEIATYYSGRAYLPVGNTEYWLYASRKVLYPGKAFCARKEGYAVAKFDITEEGRVENAVISEASDEVFHSTTLQHINTRRYFPRTVEGVAVEVSGVRAKTTFTLEPALPDAPEHPICMD